MRQLSGRRMSQPRMRAEDEQRTAEANLSLEIGEG